jgi:hypothetical protein
LRFGGLGTVRGPLIGGVVGSRPLPIFSWHCCNLSTNSTRCWCGRDGMLVGRKSFRTTGRRRDRTNKPKIPRLQPASCATVAASKTWPTISLKRSAVAGGDAVSLSDFTRNERSPSRGSANSSKAVGPCHELLYDR